MEGKLLFVQHDVQKDKKAARRFVMLGKNAGKTFRRRSRLELQPSSRRRHDKGGKDGRVRPATTQILDAYSVAPHYFDFVAADGPSDVFLTLRSPVPVCKASREIINEFFEQTSHRLYPVRIGVSLHEAKRNWLEVLFTDAATYHCNIALMQACNEIFLHNGASSSQALHYLSQTFALVRQRLQDDKALSDGTVAIVLSLVIQEQIRGEAEAAALHWRGVQKMIELRGGFGQLEGNRELVLKACKVDITLALMSGGPSIYFRDSMPDLKTSLAGRGIVATNGEDANDSKLSLTDPYLERIRQDILHYFCALLNEREDISTCPFDLHSFYEINTSIWYRLLRFRTLRDILQRRVDEVSAVHLGMVVFMMTVFLHSHQRQIIEYSLVRQCIRHVLNDGQDRKDQLWFCAMSLVWVAGDAACDDLKEALRRTCKRFGITTWTDVRRAMSGYPWIDALHNELARNIWDQLCVV